MRRRADEPEATDDRRPRRRDGADAAGERPHGVDDEPAGARVGARRAISRPGPPARGSVTDDPDFVWELPPRRGC